MSLGSDAPLQKDDDHTSAYNGEIQADCCHFCPRRRDLQTHHIVPQRKNGSDRVENLVIDCEQCHEKLEGLYDKRFYERLGLSDDRGEERSHFACSFRSCTESVSVKIYHDRASRGGGA